MRIRVIAALIAIRGFASWTRFWDCSAGRRKVEAGGSTVRESTRQTFAQSASSFERDMINFLGRKGESVFVFCRASLDLLVSADRVEVRASMGDVVRR